VKPRPPLPPPPYLVVGLARSGVSAALALRAADPAAVIAACDRGEPPEAAEAAERLGKAGVEIHLGTDGLELFASQRPRTVVKSPGVPADAPAPARARDLGLEVVGELEIGWRLVPNEFCAVTGTNGKTTTTELIGAIHRAAGLPVAVAGNVGTPVSSYAGGLAPDATVVCEASSFQLEDSDAFSPEAGVFLNFAEDHLDRHAGPEQYLDAKLRLFANQRADDLAVLNAAEPALRGRELGGSARRVWYGNGPECELRLEGGRLWWDGRALMDTSELGLRGPHNLDNAMAAAAATLAQGIGPEPVRKALREFRGLPHRLEPVAEFDEVLFVNDSKATNVAAAVASLRAFEGGVHVILGGRSKGAAFGALAPVVAERCRAAYLIGEAAELLEVELSATGSGVELRRCGDLERAVREASQRARAREVVLLAPACASFDQYSSFEERGDHFRTLVEQLAETSSGEAR
jgi:UDP-N-acetylmuramoylalanine--D-glutamate ligase